MSKKIIFTAGVFDMLHYGHLNILFKAKQMGDYLIVAVSSDKLVESYKGIKPIICYKYRSKLVKALRCVDKVVQQKKLIDIEQFKKSKADFFVLADDQKDNIDHPGIQWLLKHDKVIWIPYTKSLSSTVIKEKIIKNAVPILKNQSQRRSNGCKI